MKRPMLWFAALFLGGELMRLAGILPWQVAVMALVCMYVAGSMKSYFRVTWIRLVLPVFFLSGYVACTWATAHVTPDAALVREEEIFYSGRIFSVDEKENTYAVKITSARICGRESEKEQKTGIILYADKETGRKLYAGSVISGSGQLTLPECASNPGQFDARSYDAAEGICYIVFPDTIRVDREAAAFRKIVEDLRRREKQILKTVFDAREAGILKAMLLGDKVSLEEDTRELYRLFGIVHILAISGMHLSLIGNGLYRLLKGAGVPQRPAALAASFAVMSYARFVHAGPPTLRAVIMFVVMMLGEYAGRQYDGISALAFSFLIIMARFPLAMTQPGLQYSLLSVLALYLVLPAAEKLLVIPKKGRARRLWGLLGPPLAVMACTLPLSAYYYGEIPLAGLPANLLVVPLLGLLMPLGLLTGGLGLISLRLASFTAGSVHFLLGLSRLPELLMPWRPYLTIRTGSQLPAVLAIWYLALAAFVILAAVTGYRERRLMLMLLVFLLVLVPFRRFGGMAAFLDVGQGDCLFIRFDDGTTMLSDGGSSDVKAVGKYRIMPFLDHYGVDQVDFAFVSHGDADHYSGILELLEKERVRRLILTKAGREDEGFVLLAETAREHDIEVVYAEQGDRWDFGEETVTCIYPGEHTDTEDINDRSMVMRVACSHYSLLLTGDISSEAEAELAGRRGLRVDILKVPHHGSKYSSSDPFLAAVSPEISVVSVGAHNPYGHPHKETLERLRSAGSRILTTSTGGAILLRPGREGTDIRPYCPEGKRE